LFSQNNPVALNTLASWHRFSQNGCKKTSRSLYLRAAEQGWVDSTQTVALLALDEGDLREAITMGASVRTGSFWVCYNKLEKNNEISYQLGWGLYWYMYGTNGWLVIKGKSFGNRCIDYYCSCVELQKKSIFTFLQFWNQTTGGIKGPGQIIGKMVWETREENVVERADMKNE
jgi:hypothetical protein